MPDPDPDPDPDKGEGEGEGKLTAMDQPHLTLGAHLLLWVFPLVLTVFVVADTILDRRRGRL